MCDEAKCALTPHQQVLDDADGVIRGEVNQRIQAVANLHTGSTHGNAGQPGLENHCQSFMTAKFLLGWWTHSGLALPSSLTNYSLDDLDSRAVQR